MTFKHQPITASGIKITIKTDGKQSARATLYILKNDLHKEPFGFLEDVFVDENLRGQGIGTKLINEIIEIAKKNNCYKIICTSRHSRKNVHKLYERLGFERCGIEFRMNIQLNPNFQKTISK